MNEEIIMIIMIMKAMKEYNNENIKKKMKIIIMKIMK